MIYLAKDGEKLLTQYEGSANPITQTITIIKLRGYIHDIIRFIGHESVHLLLFRLFDYSTSSMLDNIYYEVEL